MNLPPAMPAPKITFEQACAEWAGQPVSADLISAAPELLSELIRLKTELGGLANELHNTRGPVTPGDLKAAGAEMMRIFAPAIEVIAKAKGRAE